MRADLPGATIRRRSRSVRRVGGEAMGTVAGGGSSTVGRIGRGALVLVIVALSVWAGRASIAGGDVEQRIADFWKRVDAMQPGAYLSSADLGQWALNVIERDPRARLTVADFRAATVSMQSAIDRAGPAPVPPVATAHPCAGPGGSTPTPEADRDGCLRLTVRDAGFGARGAAIGYAFTLNNWSARFAADGLRVDVRFYDAKGSLVTTTQQLIPFIGPRDYTGYSGTFVDAQTAASATSVVVTVAIGRWVPVTATRFLFTYGSNARFDAGSWSVTGDVRNPFPRACSAMRVSAMGIGPEGQIVGAGVTYVDLVSGATVRLSIAYVGATPTSVVLHVQPTSYDCVQ